MSSSLIGRPIHSALSHIKAKRFVNYILSSGLAKYRKKLSSSFGAFKLSEEVELSVAFVLFSHFVGVLLVLFFLFLFYC